MKFSAFVIASCITLYAPNKVAAFSNSNSNSRRWGESSASTLSSSSVNTKPSRITSLPSLAVAEVEDDVSSDNLDYAAVQGLPFRALQRECKERGLPATGNTASLRARLLESLQIYQCTEGETEECIPADFESQGFAFSDESDTSFNFEALLAEIDEKAELEHWKAATRKLKKLSRRYATDEMPVPQATYSAVLEACVKNKLHGARASEPARKIMEEMAEKGYSIPATIGNQCVLNCLGNGPNGTHDGCGGIDTALAMLAAMESSSAGAEIISVDTYGSVVSALSREGAIDEALLLLRAMVVEHSFTPALSTFADVAKAAAKKHTHHENVLQVMALSKASGYVLDNVASAEAGRDLLASGVIAAEEIGNLALGLRLLTAASKAGGCAPDRGDDLVASSSSAAQRACTLIHKRAIDQAVKEDNWKLAVKILTLMLERSLNPATSVWRKVVTCCAKEKKSKRATAMLLDWIAASEEGKAEKPPVLVFNTVVNACESCGEDELTLEVLEALKKVHGTSGNIVTSNIALKRLAKLGNTLACEGLIIGMLEEGIEPSVVTYTTAIGACVKSGDSATAQEWLRRMRSRNVQPNYHTYNTALAACLDGKLECTTRGSAIATEMLADIDNELENGLKGNPEYHSVIPDKYTKVLSRSLMKQLRVNWRAGDINMAVAKATVRVPLLKLVDFERSEAAKAIENQKKAREEARQKVLAALEGDDFDQLETTEAEVDLSAMREMIKKRMEV
jgi:pentatricopeptide repeat protein